MTQETGRQSVSDILKSEEKQAWIRFILGLVAFAGVVWGASANMTVMMGMITQNQKSIAEMVISNKDRDKLTRGMELSLREYTTKQEAIVDSLERIEKTLGTK